MKWMFLKQSLVLAAIATATFLSCPGQAQVANGKGNPTSTAGSKDSLPGSWNFASDQMKYRCIGPFRGGRSCAVAGIPGQPQVYYFGSTGGGVWKTTDAGATWRNVSDGFFGGSIGSIAISQSDPETIYVGGGEKTVRGNVSHGKGVWKSADGGKTWTHVGLSDSRHVTRLRIDPKNPDVVYASAMGHLFGPNQQRGIFKTTDGGKNWKRVLFVNEEVGAVDLAMDPNNSHTLYATTWRIKRTPFSLESGGQGCGLFKSTDAGNTWKPLHKNPGFAKSTLGIIGVTVSPADSNRVWALAEAKDGGLFRSDNGGRSWTKVNEDRNLRQRTWYYTRLQAGSVNKDEVYVMNVQFWRSVDGGKNFSTIRTRHSDHHDLWIDPKNDQQMIIADDGGAQVSFNRGKNWSPVNNQPTAQFYRVNTDDSVPYRIYGAQQDNSAIRIASSNRLGRSIGEKQWESTAGGESGHLAPDPENNNIVYGGSYGGYLTYLNHTTGQRRTITVWPDNPIGRGAGDTKYRFQWNFPIFFSPHNSKRIYAAGNALFKSENQGHSWTPISPDLSRNDSRKLGPSGGPITKDNTGVETYCTIFAALESPHKAGIIWAGTDDGRLHITRDDGKKWTEITPPELPEWSQINSIEAHPTNPGGLYVAATRYKLDDFKPYIFKTSDYGKTWEKITTGIARDHFTRVIRADSGRPGMLFAGTEEGIYVSFNDGKSWSSFQKNLPIVPITDLAIKNDDLVVATQGRSFWILGDLWKLREWKSDITKKAVHVFQPKPTFRRPSFGRPSITSGENPTQVPTVRIFLKNNLDDQTTASVTIKDGEGRIVSRYSTKPNKEKKEQKLNLKKGMNHIRWSMRYPGAESFKGMILWMGGTGGPTVIPGDYPVEIIVGNKKFSTTISVKPNPGSTATDKDYQAQLNFLLKVRDKLTETHKAIKTIRKVIPQVDRLKAHLNQFGGQKKLIGSCDELKKRLSSIENALYQTKNRSGQDPLNFPIKLNNRLSALVGNVASGDNPPTVQAEVFRKEVTALIDQQLKKLKEVLATELPKLNESVFQAKVPAIILEKESNEKK